MIRTRFDEVGGVSVDPVTALYRLGAGGPNLTTALAAASATGRRVGLLHIDIDRFGTINENMGELVGDQALAAIAQRLHKAMPTGGWLWRLGSDEFLAGIGYRHEEADGTVLAERLRDAFETPLSIPPYTLPISISIGVAIYPDHAQDAASLLATAEQAVRRAKHDGPGGVGLFSIETAGGNAQDDLSRRFVEAIANSEFRLFHQPVVNANDGSIAGFSTVLRWQNEQQGLLRPNRFLQLVERVGLSARVGYWVVETAARQLATWREQGIDYLNMSVHLASPMLTRPDCLDQIGELLHRFQLPGGAMEFEIAESVLGLDARHVYDTLAGLRALGATLTVQDFGLGG